MKYTNQFTLENTCLVHTITTVQTRLHNHTEGADNSTRYTSVDKEVGHECEVCMYTYVCGCLRMCVHVFVCRCTCACTQNKQNDSIK